MRFLSRSPRKLHFSATAVLFFLRMPESTSIKPPLMGIIVMCRLTGNDFDGKFTYLLIIGRKDGVKITPVGD